MGWISAFTTNNKMDIDKLDLLNKYLSFHHFGFVCKSIDEYKNNFIPFSKNNDFYLRYDDVEQNVRVGFIELKNKINIELIEVLNDENYSPIKNFIAKNISGYHHICYESPAFDKSIDYLKNNSFRLISKTNNGFEGRSIAFFIPKKNPDGPLIEIASNKLP